MVCLSTLSSLPLSEKHWGVQPWPDLAWRWVQRSQAPVQIMAVSILVMRLFMTPWLAVQPPIVFSLPTRR